MENCSIIKDENGRLALEEVKVRRIWKEYFEDLYNIDTVHMYDFDGVRRGNYFEGEPMKITEVEVRGGGKLRNG